MRIRLCLENRASQKNRRGRTLGTCPLHRLQYSNHVVTRTACIHAGAPSIGRSGLRPWVTLRCPCPWYLRAKPRHRDQRNPKASDERGQENDEETEAQRSKQLAQYTANASQSQDANAGPSVQTLPVLLRDPAGEKRRNKHSDLAPFLPSGLPVSLQQKPEGTGAPCSTPPIASTQVSLQVGTRRLPRTSSLPQPRSTAGGHLPLCTRAGWHTCLHPKLVQQQHASPSFLPHSHSGPCPAPITCRNLMWPSLVKAGHWEWLSRENRGS